MLENVLYAPQFKQNLLSISQFTTDNNCVFKFDKNGFLITNREHGILLAEGKRAKSLYHLAPTKQVALFSNRQTKVDAHTWNYRLGHCSPKTFDILLREMDLSKRTSPSLVFQVFVKAVSWENPRDYLLHLLKIDHQMHVHKIVCNLWGPAPISSKQNCKYYASFVDDFSHFTWIYHLNKNSDFYATYGAFKVMILRQFNTNINIFHSDGRGEFIIKTKRTFCKK